jgi:YggT family protein
VRFLYQITEPLLEPIRAILPATGMIDFSPMLAMFVLLALQRMLSILANNF